MSSIVLPDLTFDYGALEPIVRYKHSHARKLNDLEAKTQTDICNSSDCNNDSLNMMLQYFHSYF